MHLLVEHRLAGYHDHNPLEAFAPAVHQPDNERVVPRAPGWLGQRRQLRRGTAAARGDGGFAGVGKRLRRGGEGGFAEVGKAASPGRGRRLRRGGEGGFAGVGMAPASEAGDRPVMLRAALLLASVAVPAAAFAQGIRCGVDCGDGTFTSCNDDADLSGAPVQLNCSASLGSCSGEIFCATLGHQLPPSAYPLDIESVVLVAADDQAMAPAMPFDLLVYEDRGQPAPGPQIGPVQSLSIPGNQRSAVRIDLTTGGFSPIRVLRPTPFRVCLRKQFDAGHNVCLDSSGTSAPRRNWAFVTIAADPARPCSSTIIPGAWYEADGSSGPIPGFPGLVGDFILRARVRPASLAQVPGADDCGGGREDAGIAEDAGPDPADAGPADDGAPGGDGSIGDGPRDAAPPDAATPDAAPPDAAMPDAAEVLDASAADGAMPDPGSPPPRIEAVSPRSIPEGIGFEVTVVGAHFQPGLSIRLGSASLGPAQVFGQTTAVAPVAAGLAPGVYPVVVQNPDGQAAIADGAVTIESAAPAASGCATATGGPAWWLLAAALLQRRSRRGSRLSPAVRRREGRPG